MNQLSPGPHDSQPTGPDTTAGTATSAGGNAAAKNDAAGKNDAAKYDAVAGPFTIRDLTVFGSTLLMFVASLLPMFGDLYNLWNLGNLFFLLLGIILPLVVVALFVARRLQPGTVVRVGSLSVDQFASVVASFAFPLVLPHYCQLVQWQRPAGFGRFCRPAGCNGSGSSPSVAFR